jgi:hypothetical protein
MEDCTMDTKLCLYKLQQLRPTKVLSDNTRTFKLEEVKGGVLSELIDESEEFDKKLIPFLVGAVQFLADRVEKLEASLQK